MKEVKLWKNMIGNFQSPALLRWTRKLATLALQNIRGFGTL
jgi:3-dehydroquinate synthetase